MVMVIITMIIILIILMFILISYLYTEEHLTEWGIRLPPTQNHLPPNLLPIHHVPMPSSSISN